MLDGAERAFVAAAGLQAPVLGGEVVVLGAGRRPGRPRERDAEPLGAVAGRAGAALAGGLVVAGAHAGPATRGARRSGSGTCRRRSRRGCTSARAPLDAGDRAQQLNAPPRKGAICSSIASESRSICSSRKSMWARIAPTQQRVVRVEAALQRLAQRGDLLAQPALAPARRARRGRSCRRPARRASRARTCRGCRWRRSRA